MTPASPLTPPDVECALQTAFGVILPRLQRDLDSRRLGICRPPTAVLAGRTGAFVEQLAAELGEWPKRIVEWNEAARPPRAFRRIERHHRDEAVLELVEAVGRLPAPWRAVVIRRAGGMRWRDIAADLPGRLLFSLKDDWRAALKALAERADPAIRRII